jgi:myo-inositol-1(or 4)-monophosphatase
MVTRVFVFRSLWNTRASLKSASSTIRCATRCFAAQRGEGATLNDRKIRVSSVDELSRAMLCTGISVQRTRAALTSRVTSPNFTMNAQAVRRDWFAALDLAYVACGRFEGFWEMV